MTEPKFIVFSLPRSRSSWLTHWLGDRSGIVGHDTAVSCNSIRGFLNQWNRGMVGTVETGAVLGYKIIRAAMPDLKIAVVRREPALVIASLARFGIRNDKEILHRDRLLDELSVLPGVMSIKWEELDDQSAAAKFWHHLRGSEFDSERWDKMCGMNIQINVDQMKDLVASHRFELEVLKAKVAVANKVIDAGGDLCSVLQ